MNSKQIKHFKASHRRMRTVHKENFQFTVDEWLAFWDANPLMPVRAARPGDVIVTRKDATLPWSITNIVTKRNTALPKPSTRVRTPAGPRPEPYANSRTLTVKEWISEVRR
ncbi:hypothetical protein [Rhizobium mongolense]|uniref:Uncharacterized protein n=2 Tax=Rhizobium mongolense TaxID=57676 RepID=A0ABR6IQ91_9HYPH|nr:hypothetical protein [Rhizobium mongolense]MBB4230066.1 hypothetical protein [Rhizobium mongolense]TVZ72803.1 hypothetical protein BCL32_0990 [Rhizobium mongolense USDA 1844]